MYYWFINIGFIFIISSFGFILFREIASYKYKVIFIEASTKEIAELKKKFEQKRGDRIFWNILQYWNMLNEWLGNLILVVFIVIGLMIASHFLL